MVRHKVLKPSGVQDDFPSIPFPGMGMAIGTGIGPQAPSLYESLGDSSDVDETDNANESTACDQVKKLYEIRNKKDGTKWVEEAPKVGKPHFKKKWRDAALLVCYRATPASINVNPYTITSISIQNHALRAMVQNILKDWPGIATNVQDLTLNGPLHPFFHRWDDLTNMLHSDLSGMERKLLAALHDVLHEEFEGALQRYSDLISREMIDFELLWTIFPAGCVVLSHNGLDQQCALVVNCRYVPSLHDFKRIFHLDVAYIDCDGYRYGWTTTSVMIREFDGVKHVSELGVLPIKYYTTDPDILHRLETRGKSFVAFQWDNYKAYQGSPAAGLDESRIVIDAAKYGEHSSPIILTAYPHGLRSLVPEGEACLSSSDYAACDNTSVPGVIQTFPDPMVPSVYPYSLPGLPPPKPNKSSTYINDESYDLKKPSICAAQRSGRTNIATSDVLAMHRWTLSEFGAPPEAFCPPQVRGHCLTSKKWLQFRVENISPIEFNDAAYDRLVIPHSRKRILSALAKTQRERRNGIDDMIKGKGQGLILLLNGPPGTGKTLTAEAIADKMHLPLYAIDTSQLSDDIEDLEDDLRKIFRLAEAWDVVLLLDEADAFLERRTSDSKHLKRNKRVAVFLRVLEYFRGILILTSNREVEFDEAFHSRIDLTLRYSNLNHDARTAVWKNILSLAPHAVSQECIESFAERNLNGRQIKNTIKMARLLAISEGHELNAQDVRDVIDITNEEMPRDWEE
jgi:hypothetical protein